MRVIGVGIDIVSLDRVAAAYTRYGARFGARILSAGEMGELMAAGLPAAYLAKRFAAKEAMAKALGTGFSHGVYPKQIEVVRNALGRPGIQLLGETRQVADRLGVREIHLSLSDERTHAVAHVLLVG